MQPDTTASNPVSRSLIDWILLLITLVFTGYFVYIHQPEARGLLHLVENTVNPCAKPLTYSVGSIDSRFGISKSKLVADLKESESIWEKSANKDLFAYTESGGLVTVNLMYDSRQASTDKLKQVGIKAENTRASYDSLKSSYDSFRAKVNTEQTEYKNKVAQYKQRESAYSNEVNQWNQKGGAQRSEFERMQAEKTALAEEFSNLKVYEVRMNGDVDTLNALATRINQLIVQFNLNATQYNTAGTAVGEFEEGVYELKAGIQTINIYEYSDHIQLVRVLAHELGHALGLSHVSNDPEAIIYAVNRGRQLTATKADIAEINSVCRK